MNHSEMILLIGFLAEVKDQYNEDNDCPHICFAYARESGFLSDEEISTIYQSSWDDFSGKPWSDFGIEL